jgi:hypothetical protein
MNRIKPALKFGITLGISALVLDARAIGIPNEDNASATLTIDGDEFNVTVEPTDTGFQVPAGTIIRSEEAQITFTDGVQMNPDPSIAYGFAVIDFGAPSTFGFTFATPIVPTGGPASLGTEVASTLAGGLTDFTDDGVSISPTPGADVQVNSVSSSGLAGPYVNMGVDLGPAFSAAGGGSGLPVAFVYGPYSEGLIPGPAGGPFDALRIDLSFDLSGNGDIAALTGSASIINSTRGVPDGGAGIAGIAAITALLAFGRKRRN